MEYKNVKVNWVDFTTYLGDGFKTKSWRENERYFGDVTKDRLTFNRSWECPIEDLICTTDNNFLGESNDELLKNFRQLKKVFPNSHLTLNLDDFVGDYNLIDLTEEEFIQLYPSKKVN